MYNVNGEIMKKVGIISITCVIVDQIIKYIVCNCLKLNESISIIKRFFSLTYVRNDGAAWSIFSGNRLFLILIALATIVLIYLFFIKDKKVNKMENITYGLLLGGIIGNLIDRISVGSVVDYLDFKIIGYNFPVFNFADMCIVVSVFLIIFEVFRGEINEIRSK